MKKFKLFGVKKKPKISSEEMTNLYNQYLKKSTGDNPVNIEIFEVTKVEGAIMTEQGVKLHGVNQKDVTTVLTELKKGGFITSNENRRINNKQNKENKSRELREQRHLG